MAIRKITAGILSCAVAFGALALHPDTLSLSCAAETAAEEVYGWLHYVNHGDHIEITGHESDYVRNVIIPAEIDGLPVTEISSEAFSGNAIVSLICHADITNIPAGCFQDCVKLETVILPDTVESIEAYAFNGCEALRDVFYEGDDAGWDAVSAGAMNVPLQNAYVHTNFTALNGEAQGFVSVEDDWSFTAAELEAVGFSSGLSHETIMEYLADCHPDTKEAYLNFAEEHALSDYITEGLALVSWLVSEGALTPSDIYEGAETLYEIPACEEAAVNICYFQMMAAEYMSANGIDVSQDAAVYLNNAFMADLEAGNAVYLGFVLQDETDSALNETYAVVAYGVESGEWQFNGSTYTSRLLVSDSHYTDFEEDACIYFTKDADGYGNYFIPYQEGYTVSLYSFIADPALFPYAVSSCTAYASAYTLGDVNTDGTIDANDATRILIAAAAAGAGEDTDFVNGQAYAADVNGDGEFNAVDATLVLQYAAAVGAGEVTGGMEEFINNR